MRLGLGLGLKGYGVPSGGAAGPTTRPSVTTVRSDGISVTDTAIITYEPLGSPQYVVMSRPGFNDAGQSITVVESAIIMIQARLPWPSQTTPDSTRAVLSENVFAGDVVSGVTNSSTLAHPLVIPMWLNRDLERVTPADGGMFTARLTVAHRFARNGRPVAAVKFVASDGTTTVEALANTMTSAQFTGSGYYVPHFAGVFNFASFAQGAAVTVDAVIYPWVGTAFQISVDADPYPSPNLTTLRVLNDRTGAYGTAYACVDPVGGNDGTAVTSATRATAVASPYLTIDAAAAAVKTFNNANHGRNAADGGVVLLKAGTTVLTASIRTTASTSTWPLTIEAENPANIATTIFRDRGTTLASSIPNQLVIRNVTLRRGATGNIVFLDNAAAGLSYTNLLSIEGCNFSANGFGSYNGWIYKTGVGYYINNTGEDCGQAGITGVVNKTIKVMGCSGKFSSESCTYAIVGSYNVNNGPNFRNNPTDAARPASVGAYIGQNLLSCTSSAHNVIVANEPVNSRGLAMVGNVLEQAAGDAAAAISILADSNVQTGYNILDQCNTIVGSRSNWLYQDTGTATVIKHGWSQYSVHSMWNTKTDVFGTNSNLVGNWGPAYHVGYLARAVLKGGSDGSGAAAYGAGSWIGEVAELGSVRGTLAAPLVANFVSDRSFAGTGAGNGDYRPQAGHQLPLIPAGKTFYPIDMRGAAIPTNGTAVVGALQAA